MRRSTLPKEVAAQAVIDEVVDDREQNNGPSYVKTVLQGKGIFVPRYVNITMASH